MSEKNIILKQQHANLVQIVGELRKSKASLHGLGVLANALEELDRLKLVTDERLSDLIRKQAQDAETIYALALEENADAIPAKYYDDVGEIIVEVVRILSALDNQAEGVRF